MNKKQIRPFGVKDEIGYVFGDMAGSFVNLFVDAYFLIFCTNVLGISAGWMGTLFLVARLWDAINDPIMGSFPDRWMIGKSGDKFKPWIKIFMLPLALSGVLCFFNVPLEGIALHAYVAFAYVLYGMSYTGTSMPFGAMASVVSDDPIQRSKLSRARSIGGTIVGIVGLSIVPVVCFDKQSNILPERFTLIAVIFGVLSIISYFVLLNFTQERIRQNSEKAEKFNYGKVLKATVHNRPLIGVMVATLGSMLFITGSNQVRSYIFKEYYARTDVMSIISLATIPILVICFPLVPKLVAKFGKKATLMAAIVSSTVFSVIPVVMEIKNVYIYSALVVLGTIGQTVFTMLIWALVTDCLDYSEWKFNERSDGSMYSLYTFSRKIGSTIASTGVSFGLAAIGFVSGSNVVQTAEAVNGIYFLVNIIPVVTCILELVGVGLIFNLNKETTERMYAELKAK
ncbi:MFS transporter [Mediterraneibacter gnavus]|uniref:MFS transporter n=1 Tax=Mediterraneibacter gnavus TaxID=33038 RepID=A0A9X3KBJ8_MEDGN|nr:MFS transporter [Mediterraneibacter gnavus]MCZ7693129.1 MFS transporter [Mediterraneibacter gnavus]MCZ7734771.1 MFS transporter [Mediterraneibacter gnavus]MDC6146344.1 MFS transporter [Mediterraneibacter gnavus]MDE1199761.1 MFS transporter [Mediterraneibacter gnavus]